MFDGTGMDYGIPPHLPPDGEDDPALFFFFCFIAVLTVAYIFIILFS